MGKKHRQWQQYSGWVIVAVIVIVALVLGLRPAPVLVEIATIERTAMQVTIDEEGMTRVKDRYLISAPVTGYIPRIDLDVGDRIQRDQTLSQLEPLRPSVLDPRHRAEAQARVAAAQAALAAAEQEADATAADAEFAQQELARKEQLKDQQYISQEALQLARSNARRANAMARSAQFVVDVARYDLEAAQTALQYSAADSNSSETIERVAIKSPVDGVVLTIHRKSEGVAQAGTPLLEMGDPMALEIAVDVLSFDAVQITPGMEVDLKRWGGETLQGTVSLVEPVGFTKVSALGVEEQRVWVIVDLLSPPQSWQRLGDGYRVEASFLLWQSDDVIQAPSSSLFRYGDGWAVFVVENQRAQHRIVSIGHQNGLTTEIRDGLAVGETVVIHPDSQLRDGARIKVRQQSEP